MSLFAAGVSTLGLTTGNTGTQFGTIVFSGSNITLSQITGTGGTHTLGIINQGPPLVNIWQNMADGTSQAVGSSNATLWVFPLAHREGLFPGFMFVQTMLLNMSANFTATSASAAHSYTVRMGLYTVSNSSTLALLNSVETTWAKAAATSNTAHYHGPRWLTFHSSQFSSLPFISFTQYYVGLWGRSSGQDVSLSFLGNRFMATAQRSGTVGASVATATSQRWFPFLGQSGASFTTALPTTIHQSALHGNTGLANFIPQIVLNNLVTGTW